jgi:peptide/nickel transport system substrate-binding protein
VDLAHFLQAACQPFANSVSIPAGAPAFIQQSFRRNYMPVNSAIGRTLHFGMMTATMAAITALTTSAYARDLVVALKTEPTSMDPQYHALTPNIQLSQTLFEGLTCSDADLAIKPCLAESWAANGKTWTFKLRPNVKFSDGSPFTSADVVFTLDRAGKVPNSPSSFKVYLQKVDKVEAVDPLTVRITTSEPYPLLAVNMVGLPIMSAKAAAGPAAEGKTTTELNSGSGLVGAGPYRFVSWKRGSEIIFERNPHYWGPAPAWDKVTYRPISNPAARVAALLAGDVDLAEDPPTDDLERLQKDPKLTVETKASNRVIYVALDQHSEKTPGIEGTNGKNPLLDKRVREALSLAVDRQALVARIMGGVGTPAAQLLAVPHVWRKQKPGERGQSQHRQSQGPAERSRLSRWLHHGAGLAQWPLHQRQQGRADAGRHVDTHAGVKTTHRFQRPRRVLQEPRCLHLQRLHGRLGHVHG